MDCLFCEGPNGQQLTGECLECQQSYIACLACQEEEADYIEEKLRCKCDDVEVNYPHYSDYKDKIQSYQCVSRGNICEVCNQTYLDNMFQVTDPPTCECCDPTTNQILFCADCDKNRLVDLNRLIGDRFRGI